MPVAAAISPSVIEQAPAFAARFRAARPYPHLVIDEFLEPAFCRRLQREFPKFDRANARNEHGEIGRKALFSNVAGLGRAYAEFDLLVQSPAFLALVTQLTGIPALLYDREWLGAGAQVDLNGQNLDQHIGFNFHPRTHAYRRVNLELFLSEEWREEWGGCLELQSNPRGPRERNEIVRIVPRANRCVLFEASERSWSGYSPIQIPGKQANLGRRSLSVYFYSKVRPGDGPAPSHGTIYVPPALPEQFTAGRTLTPEDVEELQILVRRRDTQIEYLYHRELEFSRILNSPTHRLAAILTAPFRWLKKP